MFFSLNVSLSDLEGHLLGLVPITFEQSGTTYLLNLSVVLKQSGDHAIDKLTTAAIFEGDRSYARFGWHTDWFDINMDGIVDLVFSAPFRTHDITEELGGGKYS